MIGDDFIILAGNIGSGKTTLTAKLSKALGLKPYYEPVADNPYLSDFYHDMKRWSFPLQVYFLTHRYQSHLDIICSKCSAIQDRSIYEDAHIFARALFEQGDMSERDYETYWHLFQLMSREIRPPSLIIYLKRSVPKLLERVRLRGREFESTLSVDYLTLLNGYYDDWIDHLTLCKTLIIDTNELDFLQSEEDFNFLISKIDISISKVAKTSELISASLVLE